MRDDHTLAVTFASDHIYLKAFCHQPEGAPCRLICSKGCESWDTTDHHHHLHDYGACTAAEFVNESGIEESCAMEHAFPLRDGMPIVLTWQGDYYTWCPA